MERLEGLYILAIEYKDNAIKFEVSRNHGDSFFAYLEHEQGCCEDVYLESVDSTIGPDDLPVLVYSASEEYVQKDTEEGSETSSWYKIQTDKGYLTARFFGSGNGFYSETAELIFDNEWRS